MNIVFNKKGTVVFKSNTRSATATGGGIDSYSTLVTTDGRLTQLRKDRGMGFSEVSFSGAYELIVRYQDTIFNAIRTDLKIEVDSVRYTIQSWEKMDEKRFYLKFIINRQDA